MQIRGAGVVRWMASDGHSPYIGENGNWWQWNDAVNDYVDTGVSAKGVPGMPGQVPVQKEWKAGDTHRNDTNIVDYIYVRAPIPDNRKWYKLKNDYVVREVPGDETYPSGSTLSTYYDEIPWLKELAAKVLIGEEANLANLIFKDDKLISLRGTVDGVAADYSGQANFVPNIVIDGKNGKITAVGGEFRGVIDAVSGYLGFLEIKSGGYIDLPPTFTTQRKGRLDNSGLQLIYDGSNSQKIEWYTGLGTFAGSIQPDSNGHLRIGSTFGIRIESENDIYLGYEGFFNDIFIGNSSATIKFGGAILDNIKKITNIGFPQMAYTTLSMSESTYYTINTDTSLLVITRAYSSSGILKINSDGNGATPTNGMVKIVMNISNSDTWLKCTASGSNIRNKASNEDFFTSYEDFFISGNSLVILVYYGGYWRPHVARGR